MSSYCDVAPGHQWHGPYHDTEYGFPLRSDAELFERLILEINQAGLSWLTILKKREAFRAAYRGFDPAVVARFGARDVRRLMADAGIIRNRLKIEAAIANAKTVLALQKEYGSLEGWLDESYFVDAKTQGRKAGTHQGRVGGALQENFPVHRGRDRGRVSAEHRISPRRAPDELSGVFPDSGGEPSLSTT